jgi:hypothetical protein
MLRARARQRCVVRCSISESNNTRTTTTDSNNNSTNSDHAPPRSVGCSCAHVATCQRRRVGSDAYATRQQIRSASLGSTPHRSFACTPVAQLPCALGAIMASSPASGSLVPGTNGAPRHPSESPSGTAEQRGALMLTFRPRSRSSCAFGRASRLICIRRLHKRVRIRLNT